MKILIRKIISLVLALGFLMDCAIFSQITYAQTTDNSLNFASIMEQESSAKQILLNDAVFMVNCSSYFSLGEKKTYSDVQSSYISSNGTYMVNSELLAEALSVPITLSGTTIISNGSSATVGSNVISSGVLDDAPVLKDGVLFVPAASFVQMVMKKHAYVDGRGFVLVSQNPITHQNHTGCNENTEDIDKIYRYMQYQNPTGAQIYEDVQKNACSPRPTFLLRADQKEAFLKKINSNDELLVLAQKYIKEADELIGLPEIEWELYDGTRILDRCHQVCQRVDLLSIAYFITENTKYLDRMWKEIKYTLTVWPNYNMPGEMENCPGHFLDVGAISPALAIAYDLLYNHLSTEELLIFKEKLQERCIDYFVGVFNGTSGFRGDDTRTRTSNWGSVVGGGMFMVAISVMASETEDSALSQKCQFIAENALKMLQYPIGHFYPDGAVDEGIGYYGFHLNGLGLSLNALKNMAGTDYNFLKSKGFDDAAEFIMYIQSLNGTYNYADSANSDKNVIWYDEAYLIASLYEDEEQMKNLDLFRRKLGLTMGEFGILWGNPVDNCQAEIDAPLDKYFGGGGFQIMKSGWQGKNDTYVGIHDGYHNAGGHFDKGSFIFESNGIRWFSDLGRDNYYVDGGYFSENGWNLYRKLAEGHNCVVINPTNDGKPDQEVYTTAKKLWGSSKDKGSIAVFDLSETYGSKRVNSYKRGFFLQDNRTSLVVQDEIDLANDNSKFYHFMHVTDGGVITVLSDGKSATVEKNGKILDVTFICDAPEWKLEKWDSVYIDPTMQRDNEYSRDGITKLALSGVASGKLNISVKMRVRNSDDPVSPHALIPMESWQVEDGERTFDTKILNLENGQMLSREEFTLEASIGQSFDTAELLLNGNPVAYHEQGKRGTYSFDVPKSALTNLYTAEFSLRLTKDGESKTYGDTFISLFERGVSAAVTKAASFEGLTNDDFDKAAGASYSKFTTQTNMHLTMPISGTKAEIITSDANSAFRMSLPSDGSDINYPNTTSYGYFEKTLTKSCSTGILNISFSLAATALNSRVTLMPVGENGANLLFDGGTAVSISVLASGNTIGNTIIVPGRQYDINAVFDFTNNTYKILIDNNTAKEGTFIQNSSASDGLSRIKKFRLTYRGGNCEYTIDNITAAYEEHDNYMKATFKDGKGHISGKNTTDKKDIKAYFCSYNEGTLTECRVVDFVGDVDESIELTSTCYDRERLMVWNNLLPLWLDYER